MSVRPRFDGHCGEYSPDLAVQLPVPVGERLAERDHVVLRRDPDEHRSRGVQPKGLGHDGVEVRESREFVHGWGVALDGEQLFTELLLRRWVPGERVEDPRGRRARRLVSREEEPREEGKRSRRDAQRNIATQILTLESLRNEGRVRFGLREKQRKRTVDDVLVRQPLALWNVLCHVGADEERQQVAALQILAFQVFLRSLSEDRRLPFCDQLRADAVDGLGRMLDSDRAVHGLVPEMSLLNT